MSARIELVDRPEAAAQDAWLSLLSALDWPRGEFAAEYTQTWPVGFTTELKTHGLLVPALPSERLSCASCDEAPFHDVVVVNHPATGQPTAYLRCPEYGPTEVPLEALRTWKIDRAALVAALCCPLVLPGTAREIVTDRLWRLGRLVIHGVHRQAWFGNSLHLRDAPLWLNKAKLLPGSVLFVPRDLPQAPLSPGVVCVPLDQVTLWQQGVVWDDSLLLQALALSPLATIKPATKPVAKRASRAADIEALIAELSAHLRSARDHARFTQDATGIPRLLPRPTQKDLAKRLGIPESRVSRSFHDSTAHQLRYLWDLALDLDRVRGD